MNKVIYNYLIFNYLKIIANFILVFMALGIVLNLFEEIEFFKNLDVNISLPIFLTLLFVPNTIIKLIPFIVFFSSMWYFVSLNNKKEILTLKTFGVSNLKIIMSLSLTAFLFGTFIVLAINPITSVMVKSYENIKSNHSSYIDHLVSINKNGLWTKENLNTGHRIISASEIKKSLLKGVTIFDLDKNYNLTQKIYSNSADISKNTWELNEVTIIKFDNGMTQQSYMNYYSILSKYDYKKINSLFRNFDTMSFLDLVLNYQSLQNRGYNKAYLDQNLNSMLSLPFFLFMMTALASILTMNTLRQSNNFTFIVVGLIACVAVYYFKDLSLALGKTDRVSLSLAAWIPVAVIGLFSSIGILQINEK